MVFAENSDATIAFDRHEVPALPSVPPDEEPSLKAKSAIVLTPKYRRDVDAQSICTQDLTQTLRPIQSTYRSRIAERYFLDHGPGWLSHDGRIDLEAIIFAEENELEHRSPFHTHVSVMRAVRNVLRDDTGENETRQGLRWPHVEAMRAIIAADQTQSVTSQRVADWIKSFA
jgi:hypothetical protein